eukprot:scaffold241422_cov32-Tisochrysis_lutea.AAC.3
MLLIVVVVDKVPQSGLIAFDNLALRLDNDPLIPIQFTQLIFGTGVSIAHVPSTARAIAAVPQAAAGQRRLPLDPPLCGDARTYHDFVAGLIGSGGLVCGSDDNRQLRHAGRDVLCRIARRVRPDAIGRSELRRVKEDAKVCRCQLERRLERPVALPDDEQRLACEP